MKNLRSSWDGVQRGSLPHLSTNKSGSQRRLSSLLRYLSQNKQFETYDSIIREQLDSGIVGKVDEYSICHGKEYYMPHKVVVRETTQTTKVRPVCDASSV